MATKKTSKPVKTKKTAARKPAARKPATKKTAESAGPKSENKKDRVFLYRKNIDTSECFRGGTDPILIDLFGAKFFGDAKCLKRLVNIAFADLKHIKFDGIVPVSNSSGKNFNLNGYIAKSLSKFLKCKYMPVLSKDNSKLTSSDSGKTSGNKNILIFDHIVYSGKTKIKCFDTLSKLADKLTFYTLVKSK